MTTKNPTTISPDTRAIMAATIYSRLFGACGYETADGDRQRLQEDDAIELADDLITALGYTVADQIVETHEVNQSVEVNEKVDQFPEAGKKVETLRVRLITAVSLNSDLQWEKIQAGTEFAVIQTTVSIDVFTMPVYKIVEGRYSGQSFHTDNAEIIDQPEAAPTFTPLVITPDTLPTHKDTSGDYAFPICVVNHPSEGKWIYYLYWLESGRLSRKCVQTQEQNLTPLTPPEIAAWKAENQKEKEKRKMANENIKDFLSALASAKDALNAEPEKALRLLCEYIKTDFQRRPNGIIHIRVGDYAWKKFPECLVSDLPFSFAISAAVIGKVGFDYFVAGIAVAVGGVFRNRTEIESVQRNVQSESLDFDGEFEEVASLINAPAIDRLAACLLAIAASEGV